MHMCDYLCVFAGVLPCKYMYTRLCLGAFVFAVVAMSVRCGCVRMRTNACMCSSVLYMCSLACACTTIRVHVQLCVINRTCVRMRLLLRACA